MPGNSRAGRAAGLVDCLARSAPVPLVTRLCVASPMHFATELEPAGRWLPHLAVALVPRCHINDAMNSRFPEFPAVRRKREFRYPIVNRQPFPFSQANPARFSLLHFAYYLAATRFAGNLEIKRL
jgi:hypothetical protein